MRKSRTERLKAEPVSVLSSSAAASASGSSSEGFISSQFTLPSASLRALRSGFAMSSLRTSSPPSPSSDQGSTTTERRPTEAMVSPSKGATPTSVTPFSSSEALGKWRSRLMPSRSKSSRGTSIALASVRTSSAILPRRKMGAVSTTTSRTAMTVTAIFRNFFIGQPSYSCRSGTGCSPPLRIHMCDRVHGPHGARGWR